MLYSDKWLLIFYRGMKNLIVASIGSIIRGFVDGVIVLNDTYKILWYDVNADIHLDIELGLNFIDLFPCSHEQIITNGNFHLQLPRKNLWWRLKSSP